MTGAIYVRYSPRIEQDQSFTLENQISMCRELAAKDGVLIDENHVCQAPHVSGGSSNNRLLKGCWRISGLATFWIIYTPKMPLASQDKPMKRVGY